MPLVCLIKKNDMNRYTIQLEVDEPTYRNIKKVEVKLKMKNSSKSVFIPFSKRQIKYQIGKYLYQTHKSLHR